MKKYLFILLLFLSTSYSFSQGLVTARGFVKEVSGDPIIGANVLVKGTKEGTITDYNGNFTIIGISDKSTLVISYLGFETIEINASDVAALSNIVLKEDAKNLDEVVVIGYGTQKKSSLTSSIETIKKEDILSMPTSNLDQALVGQVAGLHVSSTTGDPSSAKESDIRIRGIDGAPLLVIDGIPRFGNNSSDGEMRLSDLNPDDIESISILKDAAAAAVYGARAANGVILVQTKRGSADKKVSVNYRGQINLTQATKLPNFLGAYDFALLRNQAIANTPGTTIVPYTNEQLEQIRLQSNPNVYADENMLDYLDKFGYSTTHSLSVSGGTQAIRYYVSGGYVNNKGLYGGVGRDRYNYSVKLDATVFKGFTMTLDVTGSQSENKNTSYSTIDAAYNYSPVQPFKYTSGELASIGASNPLISLNGLGGYIQNTMAFNTISANLKYEFQTVKGLSVYARGTFDNNSQTTKTLSTPTTLYIYDEATGDISEDSRTVYPNAKITLEERNQFVKNMLVEGGINYNNTFAGKHEVGGLFVANYQRYNNRFLTGKNEDMPGVYPEQIGNNIAGKVGGGETLSERASLIGRLTYSYDTRYYVEGSFRVDASTKFHPSQRWGFFPTVSASWVVSNEPFFKEWDQKIISNMKFRGSTGILGRDGGISDYSYLLNYMYNLRNNGYQIGDSYISGIILDSNSSFPNPNLKMEKSQDYNVAVDLGFFSNKLGITFEHYWRYRTDLITTAPTYLFPPSTGIDYNLPNINFGRIKAYGWDLTVTHKNSFGKFKYDITFIASRIDDVVLDYGDESSLAPSQRRVGRRSNLALLYQADGLFQSQAEIDALTFDQDGSGNKTLAPGDIRYVDTNDDGVLSVEDRVYVKNSSQPDYSLSLNIGLKYHSFFVSARFQGVIGYVQQINDLYTLENRSLQKFQNYHLTDTWTENNPGALYPRVKIANQYDNNRKASTYWQKDADFLRLKQLSVGYAFPSSILQKMKLSQFSIALQGSNLFTISTLKDIDPESLRGYPIQRTYGMSVSIGY